MADEYHCGTGKRCFGSRDAAQVAATRRKAQSVRRDQHINAYRCGVCGWWHFGRDSRRPRRLLIETTRTANPWGDGDHGGADGDDDGDWRLGGGRVGSRHGRGL